MRITEYEERYRDDMLFMFLQAKDALGSIPRLREDMLDIKANYMDKGDMFWLAIGDGDRVIGCVGYNSIEGTNEVWLHRFYVKADMKRQGIGTALYTHAEEYIRARGKTRIRVHLGGKGYEASRQFYPKMGFTFDDEDHMSKTL